MDLNDLRKRLPQTNNQDLSTSNNGHKPSSTTTTRCPQPSSLLRFIFANVTKTFASLLIVLPVFITFSLLYRNSQHHQHLSSLSSPFAAHARVLDDKNNANGNGKASPFLITPDSQGFLNNSNQPIEEPNDKLLGGLLRAGFDEGSCLSRYQSYMYRKASPYKPSSHLLSRLRKYEDLHKRCGPGTQPYNEALRQLRTDSHTAAPTECNYVVWILYSGLGNRMLTIASAFLYALLTNRVLLVDPGTDMTDLFCEPFPSTSWFLPQDFPLKKQFESFDQKSPQCHGFMLKNNLLNGSSVPPYLYIHLGHDYNDHDKLFFCDDDQSILAKVPWHVMRFDNYFVPSLFLVPSFEQELHKLFPDKVAVFHQLGRYLFHPTNQVWGLITRYYNSYLARADERIGIQIRTFEVNPGPYPHVQEQIQACLWKEKLLPEIIKDETSSQLSKNPRSIAVLMTSLIGGYYEKFREMYWEHPTITGEVVGFFQPSHEEYQQSGKKNHNRKAWAEIYLLSLMDKLVTSGWSTFGYTAQSLGGLRPWILYRPENQKTPDPPCVQAMSMEPCFHSPPFWDCKAKRGTDTGNIVPHVRHCEDISWGLKMVEGREEV